MATDKRMEERFIRLSAAEGIRCRGFLKEISGAFSKEVSLRNTLAVLAGSLVWLFTVRLV